MGSQMLQSHKWLWRIQTGPCAASSFCAASSGAVWVTAVCFDR